ncbi:unnamed protein product, partial [Effrenium voratum]
WLLPWQQRCGTWAGIWRSESLWSGQQRGWMLAGLALAQCLLKLTFLMMECRK